MQNNNKSSDVKPDIEDNVKTKKPASFKDTIIIGLVFFIIGLLCLFGYLRNENTIIRVVLYIFATMLISGSSFVIVEVKTPKAKSNYSMAVMIGIWAASLIYVSTLTDVRVLHWVPLSLGFLFLSIAVISSIVQAAKDIRKNSALKRIITITLILGPIPFIAELIARPIILCVIPLAAIMFYNQYLRNTFLSKPGTEVQSGQEVSVKFKKDIGVSIRNICANLLSIGPGLFVILIIFFTLFYFMITQQSKIDNISLFYEVVVTAYLGILAIVIAFAVIIRKESKQSKTGHLKLAISGLAQMYVFFALVTVAGLLMGSEVNSDILSLTINIKLSDIFQSLNGIINILRILILEFAVLAFPAGLWYLRAMIQDFIRQ